MKRKIYTKIPRQKSIRDFIFKFYTVDYPIINNHSVLKGTRTYKDKKCTVIQCTGYKYRSIDDLFIIVQTEYPSCSIKKLITILFDMSIKGHRFFKIDCSGIKKPTTAFYINGNRSFDNKYWENSKFKSWTLLLKKININNEREYIVLITKPVYNYE
tara:strand:- start:59954 stop:60424 length:471 start_codon:yes stop_codon:yes gene_type:complete